MDSEERKRLLKSLMDEVVLPQRRKLIAWRDYSGQSAQIDSDGYVGEMIAAIVVGCPGNSRRGKSGGHPGDLSDGTEVKSSVRVEQKGSMEDAHINFGAKSWASMKEFADRSRWVIVSYTYDRLDRLKVEVLDIEPRKPETMAAIQAFYERSSAAKPQLQSRLYPDGARDRLADGPTSLFALGARLLARGTESAEGFTIDIWSPEAPLELDGVLTLTQPETSSVLTHTATGHPADFFDECMMEWLEGLKPYCELTGTTRNIGFGSLSQHLTSLATGIRGTDSNARGADLENGGEIKLAMGLKGDALGTEDYPRLNLGGSETKIASWPELYSVRIMFDEADGLQAKVGLPDMDEFRAQVRDYFHAESQYAGSPNLQYHAPRTFGDDVYTGKDSSGDPRELTFDPLLTAEARRDGRVDYDWAREDELQPE